MSTISHLMHSYGSLWLWSDKYDVWNVAGMHKALFHPVTAALSVSLPASTIDNISHHKLCNICLQVLLGVANKLANDFIPCFFPVRKKNCLFVCSHCLFSLCFINLRFDWYSQKVSEALHSFWHAVVHLMLERQCFKLYLGHEKLKWMKTQLAVNSFYMYDRISEKNLRDD